MDLNFQTESELEVKTYDIDAAGHVNNIVYVRWLEDLRNMLFKKMFDFNNVLTKEYYPVVVSTNIKYKKQLKLFDTPLGNIKLVDYNHGVMNLKIEIKLNDNIAASAEQKCVLINLKTSKMILQKELNELMSYKFLEV